MALTGLFLILFLFVHLAGNLTIFSSDPNMINKYSHSLESLGWVIIALEIILLLAFLVHMVYAVFVFFENRSARPQKYSMVRSMGKPSRKTISSTTMIYTGLVILVFVVIHLKTFKFGTVYETTVDGKTLRDFHRLIMEVFHNPWYVLWYVGAMVFMGFHLRHGFWSAFQSLGANHPRYSNFIYGLGVLIAIILAVGFLFIPIWVYFFTGGA